MWRSLRGSYKRPVLIPNAAAAHLREASQPSLRFLSCDVKLSISLALQRDSLDWLFEERRVSGLEGAVFLRRRLISLACCISSCVTYLDAIKKDSWNQGKH